MAFRLFAFIAKIKHSGSSVLIALQTCARVFDDYDRAKSGISVAIPSSQKTSGRTIH
jgi:hypothetical protein